MIKPKSNDHKRDKIQALKQLQKKWISEMHMEANQGTSEAVPAPEPVTKKDSADIVAENWYTVQQQGPSQTQAITCPMCHQTMTNPQLAVPCGHSFCEACLKSKSKSCHVCCNPIQAFFPNVALQQVLANKPALEQSVSSLSLDFDQDPRDLANK